MTKYTRLTKQERCLIEIGITKNKSIREIARSIGRPPKTISLEIKRNGGYLWYYAAKADAEKNRSNKIGFCKISSNIDLKEYIVQKLHEKWHPEAIAGAWKKVNRALTISHETIYRWIYNQPGNLYLCLPRKKKGRGLKPQRSKSCIPNRVSISKRSKAINNRSEVGHYEADLVFQKGNQSQNILTIVERKSRKVMLIKNKSKHSEVVIGGLKSLLSRSEHPINSITFDNGSEFSNHSDLGIPTFFCRPGSPWEKGSVENFNGILRRYIDYKADINNITQEMLDSIADKINNKPRKILKFLTPNEMITKLYRQKTQSVTF